MPDSAAVSAEYLRRQVVAVAVARRAEELGGFIPLNELGHFPLPDGERLRVIDPGGGGIWNPRDFAATLSITTSPHGPYADREIDGGLIQYHYQKGPEEGKNRSSVWQ